MKKAPPLDPIGPDLAALEDILLSHRVHPSPELLSDLDAWCDDFGNQRAAHAWRYLILAIPNKKFRAILELAILQTGKSLRTAAREAGIRHQTVLKSVARLRKRLPPAGIR